MAMTDAERDAAILTARDAVGEDIAGIEHRLGMTADEAITEDDTRPRPRGGLRGRDADVEQLANLARSRRRWSR